jgi:transcriptional regulator GlxA family with amidase domain
MSANGNWTVGFPLYHGCTLLDFAGAIQTFSSWVAAVFESVWLTPSLEPVTTSEGVQVQPGRCFDDPGPIDIPFVPGGGEDVAKTMQDRAFVKFVRADLHAARFAGSVCTGAFIFAVRWVMASCGARRVPGRSRGRANPIGSRSSALLTLAGPSERRRRSMH